MVLYSHLNDEFSISAGGAGNVVSKIKSSGVITSEATAAQIASEGVKAVTNVEYVESVVGTVQTLTANGTIDVSSDGVYEIVVYAPSGAVQFSLQNSSSTPVGRWNNYTVSQGATYIRTNVGDEQFTFSAMPIMGSDNRSFTGTITKGTPNLKLFLSTTEWSGANDANDWVSVATDAGDSATKIVVTGMAAGDKIKVTKVL